MSERKVTSKYIPADFDPSALKRVKKHNTGPVNIPVRLMSPFSMKCTSCGEYIYKGRKFNARKETTPEKYLAIPIYRFYIKCTRCSSEITFKTDPKNQDYACERGAKRNFERWRDPEADELKETDEQRLDRRMREEMEMEEDEERDKMEELEKKMEESKREMEVADALDEIRVRNARVERGGLGGKEEDAIKVARMDMLREREEGEREDEELARRIFEGREVERIREEERKETNGFATGDDSASGVDRSFMRVDRTKKAAPSLLVKKIDTSPERKVGNAVQPVQRTGPILAGYGSDSD